MVIYIVLVLCLNFDLELAVGISLAARLASPQLYIRFSFLTFIFILNNTFHG